MTDPTPTAPKKRRTRKAPPGRLSKTQVDAVRTAAAEHGLSLNHNAEAHTAEAIASIEAQHLKLTRARSAVTREGTRMEDVVARAVSSEPTKANWYDFPGYLPREAACKAAGISPTQLTLLMERYRKRSTSKKGKRK